MLKLPISGKGDSMKKIVMIMLFFVSSSKALYLDLSNDQAATHDAEIARRVARCNSCIAPYQAKRDFEAVSTIITDYAKFLIHRQTLERLLDRLEHTSVPTISVYRVAGTTVGFVNIVVLERHMMWFTQRYAVIAGIGVDKQHQGNGYGNVLLDYAIEVCTNKLRVATIELEVHQDNKKALAWYQSKGFVVESHGPDGWISCILPLNGQKYSLIADKGKGQPISVSFYNLVKCFPR